MKILKLRPQIKHNRPGRPKGSPNKPKDETVEHKKKLPKELNELMAKKIEDITDRLTDELEKQSLLIDNDLSWKYLLHLVRLVDINRDIEINIVTKDGATISIRNKPEECVKQSYEDAMESLPVDDRGNITIR